MSAPVTDTHVHLDRLDDLAGAMTRARRAGVTVMYVTFLPSQYVEARDLFAEADDVVVGLGFHPMASQGWFPWMPTIDLDAEIELYPTLSESAIWIGEIGLDYTSDGAPHKQRQLQMLNAVLAAPTVRDKFATVHTRDAMREAVDRLAAAGVTRAAIHANGFTEGVPEIEYLLDAGYSFSVVPSIFFNDDGRQIVEAIPPDRVLIETDGPFGVIDDRTLEPADAWIAVTELARLWSVDEEQVTRIVADNLDRLKTW
ncbi:MAG TPA: TatD family hydrolase [Solirubrobacteraceae bacterium]|jgi:TatD DNase family protein